MTTVGAIDFAATPFEQFVRYAHCTSAYAHAYDCTYYTFYVLYSDYHA